MVKWHELSDGTASTEINGRQFTLWRNRHGDGNYYVLSGGLIPQGNLGVKTLHQAKSVAIDRICTTLTKMLTEIRCVNGKG